MKILKGQLHGRAEIFNGLKMTFRTKILRKKNHTTLISVKSTTNFVHIFGKGVGARSGARRRAR